MRTETEIQNLSRVAVQDAGGVAWRNNRGCLPREDGTPIRFGLANDSSKLDKVFKTGDLVGLFPHFLKIPGGDTGFQVGIFCMWECKPEDWVWRGTERERAQWAAIMFVRARWGLAGFVTHPDQAVAIALGTGLGAWNAS